MEDFVKTSLSAKLGALLISAFFVVLALPAAAATKTIVTGTVLDENGAGYPNAQIEFHTGDASVSQNFTSNSSGAFTVTYEEDTINGKSMTVEMRKPDGYAQVQNSPYIFTYVKGDATRTVTFTLVKSGKTINITVQTEDGKAVEQADVSCTSPNPATAGGGSGSGTVQNGTGSVDVTGGTWYCKPDKNLSEQNASRYPWVPIGTAQKVEFADDDTQESADLTFTVAAASTLVSVKPTDSDGNTLTSNDFKGDVTYNCYNKDYGTYVTRNKVGTDGVSSIYLLPGVCTIQAFHQILEGQSYDPSTTSFVVPETGEVEIGELRAVDNNGRIQGTIEFITPENPDGEKKQGVTIITTNLDTGDKFQNTTLANGTFDIQNVGPGHYTISVDQDGYLSVLSATVEVGADETLTDVTLRGAEADTRVKGNVLDGPNGSSLTNLPAMVIVEGNGVTFSAPVAADGSFDLQMYTAGLPEKDMELRLVTQAGADVFAENTVNVPVVKNSTFETDIVTENNEATIAGQITNPDGDELGQNVLGDNAKILAINVDDGSVEEAAIDDTGAYELKVGPGSWELYPQLSDPDATAIGTMVSDEKITVNAGVTKNVENAVVETKGKVQGTIEDASGDSVEQAPVLITNLPQLQAQGSYDPADVISLTTTTDKNGEYEINAPNGEFTAYFGSNPDMKNLMEPEAKEIIVANNSVDADGTFREASAGVEGSIDDNISSAAVTLYSEAGGTQTLEVAKDGSFSGDVAPGEWKYVASGIKDGELWTGTGEMTVAGNSTSLEPKLENTGVAFPGAVSMTADVSETIAMANSEGASVTLPPYTAGFEGEVTVELSPDPTVQFTNGIAQIGIAYEVNIRDDENFPVAQLTRPATVTLPLDEALMAGMDPKSLTPGSYNKNLESYLYDGMVADVSSTAMVIQTTHLSRFALTAATGALDATAPSKPTGLKAQKITATSALLKWKAPTGAIVTKYTLQVRKAGVKKQKQWMTYKKIKATKKMVKKLKAGTRYQFRVKACNDVGCSAPAKWVAFTTKKG